MIMNRNEKNRNKKENKLNEVLMIKGSKPTFSIFWQV